MIPEIFQKHRRVPSTKLFSTETKQFDEKYDTTVKQSFLIASTSDAPEKPPPEFLAEKKGFDIFFDTLLHGSAKHLRQMGSPNKFSETPETSR